MTRTWTVTNKRENVEVKVEHVGKMQYTIDVTGFGRWNTRRQLGEAMADAYHITRQTRAQVAEAFAYRRQA